MNKKVLKILIILAIVALIIYFIRLIFIPKLSPLENNIPTSTSNVAPSGVTSSENQEGGISPTATSSLSTIPYPILTKISDHNVLNYWFDLNSKKIKYVSDDGKVWDTVSLPNQELSSQSINGINQIIPSTDGSKVLISYLTNTGLNWLIYNSQDDSITPLPQEITNATWAESNSKIIAVIKNANNFSLGLIDLNKSLLLPDILLKNFNPLDATLKFVPPSNLYIIDKPSAIVPSGLMVLDIKKLTLNQILKKQNGLFIKPTDDGNLIFYSQGLKLNVLNLNTLNTASIPLNTLANKCNLSTSASSTSILCFATNFMDFSISIDNYLQKAIYSTDVLYNYDLETYNVNSLLISNSKVIPPIDATEVRKIEEHIYFINRYDNSLYRLTLPNTINQ